MQYKWCNTCDAIHVSFEYTPSSSELNTCVWGKGRGRGREGGGKKAILSAVHAQKYFVLVAVYFCLFLWLCFSLYLCLCLCLCLCLFPCLCLCLSVAVCLRLSVPVCLFFLLSLSLSLTTSISVRVFFVWFRSRNIFSRAKVVMTQCTISNDPRRDERVKESKRGWESAQGAPGEDREQVVGETERDRERQRETERDSERDRGDERETESTWDRESKKEREREREREEEIEGAGGGSGWNGYEVAMMGRLPKSIGLFCKRAP